MITVLTSDPVAAALRPPFAIAIQIVRAFFVFVEGFSAFVSTETVLRVEQENKLQWKR